MNPNAEWNLDTARLGRRVLVFDRLESTSDRALELAEDRANDGVAVLAWEQTRGRGQHGRHWLCPAGTGVLLSILLFPPPPLRRAPVLTGWAAVSVCDLLQTQTGLHPRIKWPNDVLVSGRKVCGILIEQTRGTVAGIGLNVNQPAEAFAAAGLEEAGSLLLLTEKAWDCQEIARALLRRLDQNYDRLCSGQLEEVQARWRGFLGLLGRDVTVQGPGLALRGRLCRLDWDGIELTGPTGETTRLAPEAVRQLLPC